MPDYVIYPYSNKSKGARALSEGLSAPFIHTEDRGPAPNCIVINWGSARTPLWSCSKVLNHWGVISHSRNKLRSLTTFCNNGVPTLEFTANPDIAHSWLSEGHAVMERHTTTGRSGAGCRLAGVNPDTREFAPLTLAPLYTKYIHNRTEYRVHVMCQNIIDIQKKVPRDDTPSSWIVRNLHTNWVYVRNSIFLPQSVKCAALAAVSSLHLDFGAVDILFADRAYVLEVNSAPGLVGTTLSKYISSFNSL